MTEMRAKELLAQYDDGVKLAVAAKDDGGPAFPTTPVRLRDGRMDSDCYSGMSLRDYFAAKAMQAIIAAHGVGDSPDKAKAACQMAYAYADGMLEAKGDDEND